MNRNEYNKIVNYLDTMRRELNDALNEFHERGAAFAVDGLDIAVKLYYMQHITGDMQDVMTDCVIIEEKGSDLL